MDEEPVFDPATRRLCPDGSCVGILGRDGRCTECGRTGDSMSAEADMALADSAQEGLMPESPSVDGGFDSGRRLCDDGACTGVIGASGACGVCGRRAGA